MNFRVIECGNKECIWAEVTHHDTGRALYYLGVRDGNPVEQWDGWIAKDRKSCTLEVETKRSRLSKIVIMSLKILLPIVLTKIILEFACITLDDLMEGDYVDALDHMDAWYGGVIIKKQANRILVHFIGWS